MRGPIGDRRRSDPHLAFGDGAACSDIESGGLAGAIASGCLPERRRSPRTEKVTNLPNNSRSLSECSAKIGAAYFIVPYATITQETAAPRHKKRTVPLRIKICRILNETPITLLSSLSNIVGIISPIWA